MFRFAHPEYLYLLAVLPLLMLLYIIVRVQSAKAKRAFSSSELFRRLAEAHSTRKGTLKAALLLTAVAMLIVALANPQVGTRMEEVKQEGVDMFIALDVSKSMLAEDIKPNRLEKAKYEIRNLIERLAGDKIGVIVFSGEAYTQFPLTIDYSAASLLLDVVDVESVPNPGTAIGSAISQAMKSYNFEEPSTKVLVIMTDGENNSGDAIEQARAAAEKGVRIYTVGLGSPAGAPIPVYNSAGQQSDFKRDRSGNIVLTKLDEVSLQEIASIGKGNYYRATNTQDELDAIYRDINSLEKREFGAKQFTEFDDKFQYFLFIAFLLLLTESILSDRRTEWLARINPFRGLTRAENKQ
ncbi:MAG: VWA domain-containing protein [Bacteroidetes bacterium]|nr:VWA domain-containing protein [Bacteroidota bacterium]